MTRYLSVNEVIEINKNVVIRYNDKEPIGVKSLPLLESAINNPRQSAFGEDAYPTIFHKATALFESLAKNHAFQSGNKRTAFSCLVIFLHMNGIKLKMNQRYAVVFVGKVVKHELESEEVKNLIELHCRE